MKKTFHLALKEFFTAESLKLLSNQKPSQTTPHNETSKCNDIDEQVLEAHDHQSREAVPLACHEQVPVVPDISSHQQISGHSTQIGNGSFNSPASEWASDFSRSSGQKRSYSQRITISRKISPAISPMVSTGHKEYGTWGGDTSSSDHDTIEVTQLASYTRKVRRKPKATTSLSEEQNQSSAICSPWQQDSYKKNCLPTSKQKQDTHSTQAVVPVVSSGLLSIEIVLVVNRVDLKEALRLGREGFSVILTVNNDPYIVYIIIVFACYNKIHHFCP